MIERIARHRRDKENGEAGFTLIELLVVVVIIGILIAIAVPLYLNYRKGANDRAAQSDLRSAVSAFEQCNADNALYPSAVSATGGVTGCAGTTTVNISDGTTVGYWANTGTSPNTSYMITTYNTKGTDKRTYCYASDAGGSVKPVVYTARPTAYAAACPAAN